ncbi:ESX secretion-associated protein EspG [Mycolicibacterium mageritense]|uniref:ESX secretion-associated protein EspG n=1 Tax=Mycolicibacterium mageritense TaxID=53462 RepID=UPI001E47A878|nr:ESX secretion-associated protein EspG [Mycolicibacterium mageritense]GJJ21661.1 hypothetical protein MTY414_53340 [Mycolicibacterium mageritense]
MSRIPMNHVGSIDVVDLTVVSRDHGRDFIPFPFMQTRASTVDPEAFEMHARKVIERFYNGDLSVLQNWAGTYVRADIRVEAHVQFIPADKTSVRVVAHRMGEKGYFARQTDADVIEIFSLSPYDLGEAVAESMGTVTPGKRPAIVVPEYQAPPSPVEESDGISVRSHRDSDEIAKIARGEISALATVQSHWRPTRRWGVDRGKNAVVWVRVQDDGDYLYAPDYTVAQPMSKPQLAARINRLIADDVAVLRRFRDGA